MSLRRAEAAGGGGPGLHYGTPPPPGRRTHRRLDSRSADQLLDLFGQLNREGQTILMVTHSAKAASRASRVLFIKDGEVYHQLYRGERSNEAMFTQIADTLTALATGGADRG